MRHRTLMLLATPAVVGAMTVAVPALAGIGDGHAAHTSSTKCFVAHIAHHRVRECLVRGPRGVPGPAGPRGFTGKTGKQGPQGKQGNEGKQGIQGPAGTARGFAVVQPHSPTEATLPVARNVTGVSEIKEGVYCVVPAAPINAAEETVVVSPEVSYSPAKLPGLIAVNAQRTGGCASTSFEVDTYTTAGALSSEYAFTIVVP